MPLGQVVDSVADLEFFTTVNKWLHTHTHTHTLITMQKEINHFYGTSCLLLLCLLSQQQCSILLIILCVANKLLIMQGHIIIK